MNDHEHKVEMTQSGLWFVGFWIKLFVNSLVEEVFYMLNFSW